jgi:uridine kinase
MIIGICGGTGSGKTTVARRILENVSDEYITFLQQDSYYRNLGDMPLELRRAINFDHPDALDNELFVNHVRALRAGETVEMPVYDFATHTRKAESVRLESKPIIIIEGILVFVDAALREQMDVKIFVDTDDDLRFIRRLKRDVTERGRTVESVIKQYLETVRPMHQQFVEPSKRHADVIIPEGGHNEVGIDLISGKIRTKLQEELSKRKGAKES